MLSISSIMADVYESCEVSCDRDRSSTLDSISSLAQQYEELDIATDRCRSRALAQGEASKPLLSTLTIWQHSSTPASVERQDGLEPPWRAPHVLVDIVDDGTPIMAADTRMDPQWLRFGTQASLDPDSIEAHTASNVDVHVEIDEEDDDVYFSTHKRENDPQLQRVVTRDCHNDELLHRGQLPALSMRDDDMQASGNFQLASPSDTSVNKEDKYFGFSERQKCKSEPQTISAEPERHGIESTRLAMGAENGQRALLLRSGPAGAELQRCGSAPLATSVGNGQAIGKVMKASAQACMQGSPGDSIFPEKDDSARTCLCWISLEQDSVIYSSTTPGILGELQGGRAQGVRRHLEKKLTQDSRGVSE